MEIDSDNIESCGDEGLLSKSVNYASILDVIIFIGQGSKFGLIESYALSLCRLLLSDDFDNIKKISLEIKKPSILLNKGTPSLKIKRSKEFYSNNSTYFDNFKYKDKCSNLKQLVEAPQGSTYRLHLYNANVYNANQFSDYGIHYLPHDNDYSLFSLKENCIIITYNTRSGRKNNLNQFLFQEDDLNFKNAAAVLLRQGQKWSPTLTTTTTTTNNNNNDDNNSHSSSGGVIAAAVCTIDYWTSYQNRSTTPLRQCLEIDNLNADADNATNHNYISKNSDDGDDVSSKHHIDHNRYGEAVIILAGLFRYHHIKNKYDNLNP